MLLGLPLQRTASIMLLNNSHYNRNTIQSPQIDYTDPTKGRSINGSTRTPHPRRPLP